MKLRLVCILFAAGVLTAGASATDDTTSPTTLLEDSYKASKSLQRENRAFFLVRLTDASTDIAPARLSEDWSKELFRLSFKLARGWNRIATEKNALVPLARVNSKLAFILLAKVEKPIPHKGQFTEDLRADASASIFVPYLKSREPDALENIRKEAKHIGDTGEYPYRAIGLVIEELFKSDAAPKDAEALFDQALTYYEKKSQFLDVDSQFYELLQSSRFAVSQTKFDQALRAFVARLESPDAKRPRAFFAEVHTAEGVYTFDKQEELLRFQIFPVLARVDRPLSIELATKYRILQHADTEIKGVSASSILGDAQEQPGSPVDKQARERLLLRRVEHLRDMDPVAAFKDARLLQTEPDRSKALASVIPMLAAVDGSLAKDAYMELTQEVDRLPEGQARLGGFVASAKAACGSGYRDSCTDYIGQAFDYGLQFLTTNEHNKNEPITQKQVGFLELTDMAQVAAEHDPQQALPRIKAVEDAGLRSYLLLYAAKGLKERERAGTGVATAGRSQQQLLNRP